ncbi:helix-turn-helix domain-containing protein [Gluconobacter sp. Dm-62]|uniref:carph-isopro domain-containing protein n=1 Tax=Gluconobacter sp. Dm-62 TaxID=2799804 RepID=UPI001B8CC436|nr:YdaS family helix-turn-helix protein [Gluconobacter sp. Dm-62]MBS1103557.1 helix-turn-helix domain-containing protein [Gluconobacter sp. Dm-62]
MTNALVIIEEQGGTRSLARKLGLSPSTVQSWKRKGSIPASRVPAIATVTGMPLSELLKACLPPLPARAKRKEVA